MAAAVVAVDGSDGNRLSTLLAKRTVTGSLTQAEASELATLLQEEAQASDARGALSKRAKYQRKLADYYSEYGRTARAIKEWIAVGRAAGELPPLDEPSQMAAWWDRRMIQRVPDEILALANREKPPGAPLDVDVLPEADGVRQARTYLAAASHKLKESYRQGAEDQVRLWSRLWGNAMDSLRKAEASERNARKETGQLVSIAEVTGEIGRFAETLRIMRLSMARRIVRRLGGLPEELCKRLESAIEEERRGEEAVFRRLQSFPSSGDITQQLDAQASLAL